MRFCATSINTYLQGAPQDGGLDTIKWIGTKHYTDVFTNQPQSRRAIKHNLLWLIVLFVIATPFGIFLAVLLDKEIRLTLGATKG